MNTPIYISACSSISPLGDSEQIIWENYLSDNHFFKVLNNDWVSVLSEDLKQKIEKLRTQNSNYKNLDPSVLYAIYSARKAIEYAGWDASENFGINIGSSRGATTLFEKYYTSFLNLKKAEVLSSPSTTLGNISSWVAQDLQTNGPEISHSITCSTALHAMLNGIAWLQSGLCDKFLVGGSEAPITPFTIAQMKALKIYAKNSKMNPNVALSTTTSLSTGSIERSYPCKAFDLSKTENTMILGEGAVSLCLELEKTQQTVASITGIGYATEQLEHSASLSANAMCFQKSMRMALGSKYQNDIDVIITHSPGTVKGDQAEYEAIKSVFGNDIPSLTNNKWKLGHSLGASGLLSVEMAILMLKHQKFIPLPFFKRNSPKKINKILINAVGFGGNAVSVIVELP